jgi:creatinine amidohydrolase/Fe(II)-dependent formamide hydrolase-like protein
MVRHITITSKRWAYGTVLFLLFSSSFGVAAPSNGNSVFLEDLTSFELRAAVANGSTTVLVPIGGTEQNGPHMALGKHNVRVKVLAGQIAQKLGNAIVAPVLAYVPEGAIFPPVAHMRFSGTISIADATFESILESTARSFKQHGFHDVVFLGDHGGYQKSELRAAEKINKEWASDARFRALALTTYYEASQGPYIQALRSKGYSDAEIGTHAGLADTSMMLAIDKSLVRMDLLAEGAKTAPTDGVYGDPRKSSAELGQLGIRSIVDRSVQAIQEAVKQHASR